MHSPVHINISHKVYGVRQLTIAISIFLAFCTCKIISSMPISSCVVIVTERPRPVLFGLPITSATQLEMGSRCTAVQGQQARKMVTATIMYMGSRASHDEIFVFLPAAPAQQHKDCPSQHAPSLGCLQNWHNLRTYKSHIYLGGIRMCHHFGDISPGGLNTKLECQAQALESYC